MKDYSEDVLKIQEAGRKLPELIIKDRQMALAFLSQNIIASQKIIEYIAEPCEAANMALAFLSQNIIASQKIIEYIAETYEAANE